MKTGNIPFLSLPSPSTLALCNAFVYSPFSSPPLSAIPSFLLFFFSSSAFSRLARERSVVTCSVIKLSRPYFPLTDSILLLVAMPFNEARLFVLLWCGFCFLIGEIGSLA